MQTSWGAEITFGWEYEGNDLNENIVEWYYPESLEAGFWIRQPVETKRGFIQNMLSTRQRWSTLIKLPGAPAFLSDRLKNEVTARVFEITNHPQHITKTVNDCFQQLEQVAVKLENRAVPDDAGAFQVHIAFDPPLLPEPEENVNAHRQIAALYQLLNDYAYAKKAREVAGLGMGSFLGPNINSLAPLSNKLMTGQELEGPLGRPYKYNYVGLRSTIYGASKIGFEVRGGWENKWPNFRSLINRLVATLQQMSGPVHFKRNRIPGAGSFTLLQHYNFHVSLQPNVPVDLIDSLKFEAERTVRSNFLSMNVPFNPENDRGVDILVKKWTIPFTPWEHHPSIAQSGQAPVIITARQQLIGRLTRYFGQTPLRRKTQDISLASQQFFSDTQLFRFL